MVDLIIGIIAGTCAGLVYKYAMQSGCRRIQTIASERLVVVLLMLLLIPLLRTYHITPKTVAVGIIIGLTCFVARWSLLQALRLGKLGATFVIVHLAVFWPVGFSMLLWDQPPVAAQIGGLVLVPVVILLLREKGDPSAGGMDRKRARSWFLYAAICFVAEGAFALAVKLIQVLDLGRSQGGIIIIYNAVMFMICLSILAARRTRPVRREALTGIASGVCVGLSSIFWIRAIMVVEGHVFFPLCTIFGMAMMLLASRLVWRERITSIQKVGIAMAILAAALITMPKFWHGLPWIR